MSYSVVTTVLSAAASYDLTDLATVRSELSLKAADTSADAWLTRAITQVSQGIGRHTKRVFPPEVVQDVFDIQQDPYPYQTPGGFPVLQLSRWPVLAVISVTQTLGLNTTQTLTEGVDFRTDPKTGQLLRLNTFTGVVTTWEAIPVGVTYATGHGALVQESHTVPATPFQVTASQAAAFSCDVSVSYASGAALARVSANPAHGQYMVAAGVYTFAAADAGQILAFAYAAAKMPADLVQIALQLITARYKSKDRDPNLIQQDTPGLGTQRWWFGGAAGQKGAYPPEIEAALEEYRVPTLA